MSSNHQDQAEAAVHVVWIECEGSFNFGDRQDVLALERQGKPETGMCIWQVWIELSSFAGELIA